MASTILADNGVSSGSAGIKTTADSTGALALQTTTAGGAATTAVTIDSSQNVGIGTSSPSYKLDVIDTARINASAAGNDAALYLRSGATTGTLQQILFQMAGSGGDVRIQASNENNWLRFLTNGSERARIDSSGNLLVGTTATVNAAKSVFSFSSSNNGVYLVDSTGVSGAQFMRFDSTSNTCGQITRVGATSAVLYNTSSDYRLKENPTPLTGALERIAALKPVQWVWKDCGGAVGEGFIAHEVQEVIPSAVTGEKDAVNADGSINPQGMDASYLVATLTAAIQEQQALINVQQAALTTLTERITALEAK